MDFGTSVGLFGAIGTIISLVVAYFQWQAAKRQRREAERLSELLRHKSDIMTGFLHGILAGDWPDKLVLQANDILQRIDPH